jgi:hypothetical protein
MSMRRLISVTMFLIALVGCGGERSCGCRSTVTRSAQIIHLRTNAIVILSPSTIVQMFGPRARELTLFYGANRMVTAEGESTVIKGPLLPMSKVVRAMYFSGDNWPDLLVRVHAVETKQMVLLRISLRSDEIRIDSRKVLAHMTYTMDPDGTLRVQP